MKPKRKDMDNEVIKFIKEKETTLDSNELIGKRIGHGWNMIKHYMTEEQILHIRELSKETFKNSTIKAKASFAIYKK